MTSSIFLFCFGSSTWSHNLVYCLYDPSIIDAIFDGVSIHSSQGLFPLPLFEGYSMEDCQPIFVNLSL
jgi:hypothetical protein